MYTINTGDFIMNLEVVRVELLQEHEETLPHVADSLSLEFKNWAHLHNPIIIDENHIVLDGNHRTFVFKKLGFKFISVCRIDYFSDNVGLRYWFRILTGIKNADSIGQIVREAGIVLDPVNSREELAAALKKNPLASGLEHGDFRAVVRFPNITRDAVSAYEATERLQEIIVNHGAEMQYVPCQSVSDEGFCEQIEKNTLVLWTPHITKDMVVEAARCGRVFTPKATRHLVAARPINVNVPIRWFRENVSLREINERFEEFLRKKEMRRFPPGQVINGRYYGEEVFVFFDKKPPENL
jgi:hypothetical protein